MHEWSMPKVACDTTSWCVLWIIYAFFSWMREAHWALLMHDRGCFLNLRKICVKRHRLQRSTKKESHRRCFLLYPPNDSLFWPCLHVGPRFCSLFIFAKNDQKNENFSIGPDQVMTTVLFVFATTVLRWVAVCLPTQKRKLSWRRRWKKGSGKKWLRLLQRLPACCLIFCVSSKCSFPYCILKM